MLIKKENLVHSFLSPPARMPAHIVEPEREIPGKTAKPCAIPMIIAVLYENSLVFLFLVNNSVTTSSIAVIKKDMGRKFPPNEAFIKGINTRAIMQVGIVATTSIIVFFENGNLMSLRISRQNTTQMESSVAICKIMDMKRLSSTPNILDKSTR